MSKNTTYQSSIMCMEMPVYPHAEPVQFITIPDFDQFENMLWHYNVTNQKSSMQACELRMAGTLTLRETQITDDALKLRLLMENLQSAFQAAQRLLADIAATKATLGKQKTKLMPKWQETIGLKAGSCFDFSHHGAPLDKLPQKTVEAITKALSRLYSYRSVYMQFEMLQKMRTPVGNNLAFAASKLKECEIFIRASDLRAIVRHNLMCAEHLGQRFYFDEDRLSREEIWENGDICRATNGFVEDQWDQYKTAKQKQQVKSKH